MNFLRSSFVRLVAKKVASNKERYLAQQERPTFEGGRRGVDAACIGGPRADEGGHVGGFGAFFAYFAEAGEERWSAVLGLLAAGTSG